jgi:hypothetical protein
MFDKATRLKLRFETPKGSLSTEDLWDLPLTNGRSNASLNEIAKGISRQLKENVDEDFVNQSRKADEVLELKLDIVKHVIAIRIAENDAAKLAAEKREKKQRLMDLIARKQDEQLEGKSLEELQAMVADI